MVSISFIMSACASSGGYSNSNAAKRVQYKNSVAICADKHQDKNSVKALKKLADFLVINVKQLDYFIVVSDVDGLYDGVRTPFCHVEKRSQEVIYANTQPTYYRSQKNSDAFNALYGKAYADQVDLSQADLAKYKRIYGIWRFIEARSVSGS